MKITRNTIRDIIYIEVVFALIFQILISQFGAPSSISYFFDVCNVILLWYVVSMKSKQRRLLLIGARNLVICVGVLSVVLLFGDLFNLVKPQLIVWAIRNSYRFFLYFFSCCLLLSYEDVELLFRILSRFQILNVLLTLYQFFFLKVKQDYLGGIFGTQQGCNAYTNIYLCVILIYVISKYIHHKTDIRNLIWISLSSLTIAAMAELKIFFVEFVIIVFGAIILSRPSVKTIRITIGAVAGLFLGLYLFASIFPEAYQDLVNIERLIEYNTTVIWGYNISRLGAFHEINEIFFHDSLLHNLFGYGFGNCEYSSFSFFTSDFYNLYGRYHYRWFAHQNWFLEGGYLGFISYIVFFVLVFIWGIRAKKRLKDAQEYALIAQLLSIITIISLWYNNSTRIEVSYILFFALAAPFAVCRSIVSGKYSAKASSGIETKTKFKTKFKTRFKTRFRLHMPKVRRIKTNF